jgi:hypothetical protein
VHHALVHRDPISQAGGLHCRFGSFDVEGDGLHADAVDIKAPDQFDEVGAVPTAASRTT